MGTQDILVGVCMHGHAHINDGKEDRIIVHFTKTFHFLE